MLWIFASGARTTPVEFMCIRSGAALPCPLFSARRKDGRQGKDSSEQAEAVTLTDAR